MIKIHNLAFASLLLLSACKDTPKAVDNTVVVPPSVPSSPVEPSLSRALDTPPDSIIVEIDSMNHVMLGNRSISTDDLADKIVDSVKTIKKKYGKAPQTIMYRSKGGMMGTRGAVKDAVEDAKTTLKKEKE